METTRIEGPIRVNDLAALVGDRNVTIHEAKVFVCRIEKG
jgi:hypothetical protein